MIKKMVILIVMGLTLSSCQFTNPRKHKDKSKTWEYSR